MVVSLSIRLEDGETLQARLIGELHCRLGGILDRFLLRVEVQNEVMADWRAPLTVKDYHVSH
jgi:hypothetical protein